MEFFSDPMYYTALKAGAGLAEFLDLLKGGYHDRSG
jgi:hypothetical protein